MAKAKNKRKQKRTEPLFVRPTRERETHGGFQSAGAAVRAIPVIVTLHERDVLTDDEFAALAHYRDQASLADKSPVRSNCDFSVRGGGNGPGVAITSASLETARIERDMGPLWRLCRAVCVDDIPLDEWCIAQGLKAKQAQIDAMKGAARAMASWRQSVGLPVADPEAVGIATMELKYAAGGIVR